jgi:hypothetical protein
MYWSALVRHAFSRYSRQKLFVSPTLMPQAHILWLDRFRPNFPNGKTFPPIFEMCECSPQEEHAMFPWPEDQRLPVNHGFHVGTNGSHIRT